MGDKYWFLQNSFDVLLDALRPVNLSIVAAASSSLPDIVSVSGCITLDKYIRGKTLFEIEKEQGLKQGSLKNGMVVAALIRLPYKHEFDIKGHEKSIWHSTRRCNTKSDDTQLLKHTTIKHTWRTYGPNCVVKVLPAIHTNNAVEPPHSFMPVSSILQWVIVPATHITARVVARVNNYPLGRYT